MLNLQSKQNEAAGSVIYYDKRMLENNIWIDVDKRGRIVIKHFNDLIAAEWHLSEDGAPSIQVLGMLKDIHELFQENSVHDFLRIVDQMCTMRFDSTDFDEEFQPEFDLRFRHYMKFITG